MKIYPERIEYKTFPMSVPELEFTARIIDTDGFDFPKAIGDGISLDQYDYPDTFPKAIGDGRHRKD
jgi:hypothetical protein